MALATLAGALIYSGAVALLAWTWLCVQRAAAGAGMPAAPMVRIYCISQFAKYLPGNVGHYVGRHVWARQHGISHLALVAAALAEAAMLVFAAIAWAAPLLGAVLPEHGLSHQWGAPWIWGIQLAALVVSWPLVRCLRRSADWAVMLRRVWGATVGRMLPMHLLFFAMLGASLYAPAMVLGAPAGMVMVLPAAAAISWLAGFLVVGAPAGIGVREVVFVGVLSGWMPEADLLALAAVMRVVTFGGDLIAFSVAAVLQSREEPEVPR